MEKNKALIAILGGGLAFENGDWRPTTFFEKEDLQRLGDNYRILAGAELYNRSVKNGHMPVIFVSGGKGASKNPDHPIIADFLKKDLISIGIPSGSILKDRDSNNTFAQLLAVQKQIFEKRFDSVRIVSSKYHIPRIRAMIMHSAKLSGLKRKLSGKYLKILSAESILLKTDSHRWKKELDSVYKSDFMAERIRMEKRGIRQIVNNTYHW